MAALSPTATGDLWGDRGVRPLHADGADPTATGDLWGDRGVLMGIRDGPPLRLPAICGVTEGAGFN